MWDLRDGGDRGPRVLIVLLWAGVDGDPAWLPLSDTDNERAGGTTVALLLARIRLPGDSRLVVVSARSTCFLDCVCRTTG